MISEPLEKLMTDFLQKQDLKLQVLFGDSGEVSSRSHSGCAVGDIQGRQTRQTSWGHQVLPVKGVLGFLAPEAVGSSAGVTCLNSQVPLQDEHVDSGLEPVFR